MNRDEAQIRFHKFWSTVVAILIIASAIIITSISIVAILEDSKIIYRCDEGGSISVIEDTADGVRIFCD
jgi:hypothetical protein